MKWIIPPAAARLLALGLILAAIASPQTLPASSPSLLARRYHEGEKLSYHMKATNRNRTVTNAYEVDAVGVVRKSAAGAFTEEYAWSNLVLNNQAIAPTEAMQKFRQVLSLDPGAPPLVPNLSNVVQLVGPITDMLTFYADLWIAIRMNHFAKAGDHLYFAPPGNKPNSWADGVYTLIGEDFRHHPQGG
jgi:hypothetical protein